MALKTFFSEQARNPSGLFGRYVIPVIFDRGNAILNTLMEKRLAVKGDEHILEIGFGTGKLMHSIARQLVTGSIEGVDLSMTMVAIAERKNASYIKKGKVMICHGEFGKMDYRDHSFDKICSANTIYFWSHPDKYLNKIHRILKPGGILALAFEDKAQLETKPLNSDIFRFYSLEEIDNLLCTSGFSGPINIYTRKTKSNTYHCVIATKNPYKDAKGES
jgi:ubiquinone/menaquinone biosynthesis C-methylase UbiE